jgi:hypothetical protein
MLVGHMHTPASTWYWPVPQAVHDASADSPVSSRYLPEPQAVHDASADPPVPSRAAAYATKQRGNRCTRGFLTTRLSRHPPPAWRGDSGASFPARDPKTHAVDMVLERRYSLLLFPSRWLSRRQLICLPSVLLMHQDVLGRGSESHHLLWSGK